MRVPDDWSRPRAPVHPLLTGHSKAGALSAPRRFPNVGCFPHAGRAQGLAAAIEAQVGRRLVGEKIILFADASLSRLAGNLPSWPPGVPESPGPARPVGRLGWLLDVNGPHTLVPARRVQRLGWA